MPVSPERLREIGILGGLSDEMLERLSTSLTPMRVLPGVVLFHEGDPARELYIVLDGEVEVLKKSRRQRDVRVAILGPNDSFGEMSIIDVQPRSATVRALGPSRLLKMTSEDLDALYRRDLKSYALITLAIVRSVAPPSRNGR